MGAASSSANPRLGIVVVTQNRVERLLATLARLSSLEARYPIAIVDNASSDGTASAVREQFQGAVVIERTTNIGGVARNDGVEALDTEYIAFADDDSWYASGSLASAIELLDEHASLALIMSRVLTGTELRVDPCCESMSRSPLRSNDGVPGAPILGFLACGAIVRRAAFLSVGGFDDRHGTGGEEAWVAWNLAEAGWALRYFDAIVSYHEPAPRTPDRMRQRRIEGIASELWNAWTRRNARTAVSVTTATLRRALRSAEHRAGVRRALPALGRSLAERRPLSRRVETQIELLEREQRGAAPPRAAKSSPTGRIEP